MLLLHHKLKVGAHTTEYLFHLVVAVLPHHYLTLGLCALISHGDVGNDGSRGKFSDVLMPFYAETKHLTEYEYAEWESETEEECYKHDNAAPRLYLAQRDGFVYEFALVSGSGERDGVLLTLLEEHDVKA